MNQKVFKILYALDGNSRITSRELGKITRSSQQSAHYLLKKIESEDWFLNYKVVVDPARFGFTTIQVLYDYNDFSCKDDAINHLNANMHVTAIEECSQGSDLYVEYDVPNLSLFNKENQKFLKQFKGKVRQMEIFPIIVKHIFRRAYLIGSSGGSDIILSGDREKEELNERELSFLSEIDNNSRFSLMNIGNRLECDPKTAMLIKKKLEKRRVIMKYSVALNTPKMNISRSYIYLNLHNKDDLNRFIEYCREDPNIIKLYKLIGRFDIMIIVERIEGQNNTLIALRSNFQVSDYWIVRCENIISTRDIVGVL